MIKHEKKLLFLGSLGAGFLSGLLGAGGGIVLYFTLGALSGKKSKENIVTSSVAVMFFCLVSLFFYKGNSSLYISDILMLAFPSAFGGACGAILLSVLPTSAVKRLFSLVIILSGILMLTR